MKAIEISNDNGLPETAYASALEGPVVTAQPALTPSTISVRPMEYVFFRLA